MQSIMMQVVDIFRVCESLLHLHKSVKSRGLDSDDMAKEQFFDTMHHF
jgi:hypothetical protein